MLNVKAYIESGIIEEYCLGVTTRAQAQLFEEYCEQYPEIRAALEEAQQSLEHYAEGFARAPSAGNLNQILDTVNAEFNLGKATLSAAGRLDHFIPISPSSAHQQWAHLTASLEPPADFDIHVHELYADEEYSLAVLWIRNSVPPEIHDDMFESALCLEGSCIGVLGDEEVRLEPGDFWDIPLHREHFLKVRSKTPAKLILMRKKAG